MIKEKYTLVFNNQWITQLIRKEIRIWTVRVLFAFVHRCNENGHS